MSERFKEAVLKTVEPETGSVGSNPTPSAIVGPGWEADRCEPDVPAA